MKVAENITTHGGGARREDWNRETKKKKEKEKMGCESFGRKVVFFQVWRLWTPGSPSLSRSRLKRELKTRKKLVMGRRNGRYNVSFKYEESWCVILINS